MTTYELLRSLEAAGTLTALYHRGLLNLKSYNHKDIFEYYQALRSTPRYVDRSEEAAQETARQCGVSERSVWRAVREMQQRV